MRWQEVLGVEVASPVRVDGGVRRRIALDNAYIDLESPVGPGPLSGFLDRHGEAPFELGLTTPAIESAVLHSEAAALS